MLNVTNSQNSERIFFTFIIDEYQNDNIEMLDCRTIFKSFNPLPAKLLNWNFHLLELVSR